MGVRDVSAALGTFVLFTGPILSGTADGQGPVWAIALLGLIASASLAWRRQSPVVVLAVVSVVLIVAALTEIRFTPWVSSAGPALGIAVFTVAEHHPRRTSARLASFAIATVTASELIGSALHPDTKQNAVHLFIGLAGWLLGLAWRTRRVLDEQLRQEAERRIRAEERLRVSADVHDIVSHALGMIAVRSGVARMALHQRPQEAEAALAAIETASRTALDELRSVLRSIRNEETEDDDGLHRRTLAEVPELVERLRAGGLPVELNVRIEADPPELIQESAYRIVQEGLTNVLKHAGKPHTVVEIEAVEGGLRISVVNRPGQATTTAGASGFGLTGMRQRVELHHGTLEAGATPDGGFAVHAVLSGAENE